MPRIKRKEEKERPAYLNADGTLELSKMFKFQPKQTELLEYRTRAGAPYLRTIAPQCLSVGGIRSGKTVGVLMFMIMNYTLAFEGCDTLILRRTFKELESGAIADFKTFVPKELYTYDQTKHVATFMNGSRVVFGHCVSEGTLVTTQRGLVPVEDVTTEDLALTRKGFKRILWSGQTGVKPTVQFGPLSITKEHKVLVDGEWKTTQEVICQKNSEKTARLLCHKPSYLKVLSTTGTQTQVEGLTEYTSKAGETKSKRTSTSQCGKQNSEQYQRVLKCTTKTETHCKTSTAILNFSQHTSTESTTPHGVLEDLEDPQPKNWGLGVGSVEKPSSQKVERNDFVMLTVAMPSEQTLHAVPVYDLQVEDEHEFFANGVLVHNCQNNKMRDIEQYLGQAYPAILIDEAGQFSPDAYMMLYSRNTVNASCKPDKHGNLPIPCIWGCTNPLGPYYEYYRTVFVQREPWDRPEKARRDANGAWWVDNNGEWLNIYDPRLYAYQRSTAMDNPELLRRDPGFIARLNSMPKAKRDKLLLGLDGSVEGQYFDCFDPDNHVINLREDPDAVLWQPWQPVWGSQDWGMGHANAAYLFTKAMVRTIGTDYKLKTVCFREIVTTGGKTHVEWATLFKSMCKYPNGQEAIPRSIFFSHEKFSKQVSAHTPADEYSRQLRSVGLPAVTRATQDRIGSASMMYNAFKNGELVILDNCKDIILAIPSLMRNPDLIDDVLKVDSRGDDCYDGFRYGLYGMLGSRRKPEELSIEEHAKELEPLARWFYVQKQMANKHDPNEPFTQKEQPVWMGKLNL